MSDLGFVGREAELARIDTYLREALAGQGRVCFVAGEPGSGKTALAREFARRSQGQHDDLLVAVGDCNAQSGGGEPFLPFREALALLTGDLEAKVEQGAITVEGAKRLERFLGASVRALVEAAPDLIGVFVPGAGLVAKLGQAVAKQAGLDQKVMTLVRRERPAAGVAQPTIQREQIFEQYARFLVELAKRQPLLVVLDDLQWIDVSSSDLLFHLTRRIGSSRILILGAYRPADLSGRTVDHAADQHFLETALAEIKRNYGDVIVDLDATRAETARQFVHALVDRERNSLLSDFREQLYQRTGGNPLFVLELLRDLRERGYLRDDPQSGWVASASLDWQKLPARIEGVIEGRIGRLEESLREPLNVAAVEGEEFTAEVVARVTGVGEREIVRRVGGDLTQRYRLAAPAGVVRLPQHRASRYRFQQRLVRDYLYAELDAARRAYLHEDVAAALESLYEEQTDDVALQLGWHFAEAGLDKQAAAYYRRAGELAAAQFANDEAVAHLTRSLALTPEREARARCDTLLAREAVYERQGKRAEQRADLTTLAVLSKTLGDGKAQAEVALRQANLARVTGKYADAAASSQSAITFAEKAGEKLLEAQGYAMLGLVMRHQGNFAEAGEWLALALDQAQALGEEGLAAQITYWIGLTCYSADKFEDARRNVTTAAVSFERLGNRMGEANCLLLLGTIAGRTGDIGGSLEQLGKALVVCRAVGWRSREPFALGDLSAMRMEIGQYDAARDLLRESLAICREVGDREGEAVNLDTLGLIDQMTGRHDTAVELCAEALAIAREIGDRRGEGYILTHLGASWLEQGEWQAARDALNAAVALRTELEKNTPTLVDNLAMLARVALGEGNSSQAWAFASDALSRMRESGAEGVEYPARAYLDCYRALSGLQTAEAVALAAQALQEARSLLHERAGRIADPALRASYLKNVPFNRELLAA